MWYVRCWQVHSSSRFKWLTWRKKRNGLFQCRPLHITPVFVAPRERFRHFDTAIWKETSCIVGKVQRIVTGWNPPMLHFSHTLCDISDLENQFNTECFKWRFVFFLFVNKGHSIQGETPSFRKKTISYNPVHNNGIQLKIPVYRWWNLSANALLILSTLTSHHSCIYLSSNYFCLPLPSQSRLLFRQAIITWYQQRDD